MATCKTVPQLKRRRIVRRCLALLLMPLLLLGLWAAYVLGIDNFHPVVPGEAYRAGQMSSNELVRCVQRHGIRSVINLRGQNPDEEWYRREIAAARALGVEHRDVRMTSRRAVTPEQATELVTLFQNLPKPVLIHCSGGADRTAFASALYGARIAQWPEERAAREFSMWYGYLPMVWKEKAGLRKSFHEYVRAAGLAIQGQP